MEKKRKRIRTWSEFEEALRIDPRYRVTYEIIDDRQARIYQWDETLEFFAECDRIDHDADSDTGSILKAVRCHLLDIVTDLVGRIPYAECKAKAFADLSNGGGNTALLPSKVASRDVAADFIDQIDQLDIGNL